MIILYKADSEMFKYDVWGWYSLYIKKDILKNIKPRVARLIIPVLVSVRPEECKQFKIHSIENYMKMIFQ